MITPIIGKIFLTNATNRAFSMNTAFDLIFNTAGGLLIFADFILMLVIVIPIIETKITTKQKLDLK